MPFRIDTQCSDKEAICEDTCLFDAIKEVNPASDKTRRTLQIDPELCTDCGACALACPEAAIHYAQGVTLSAQHYSSSVSMASVPPAWKVILQRALMAPIWRYRRALCS